MGSPQPTFDEIYRDYADRVFRFCMVLLRDPAAAEDVTADTFIAAYKAYERVAPDPEGIRPWLFRIAQNLATDQLRRQKVWRRIWASLTQLPPEETDAEEVTTLNEEKQQFLDALASLKPRERKLIGLRYGAAMSFRDIGPLVGLSEKHASIACSRAVRRLRELVEVPE